MSEPHPSGIGQLGQVTKDPTTTAEGHWTERIGCQLATERNTCAALNLASGVGVANSSGLTEEESQLATVFQSIFRGSFNQIHISIYISFSFLFHTCVTKEAEENVIRGEIKVIKIILEKGCIGLPF